MRIKETAINAVQFFKSLCFHNADWKIQEHLPVFPCDFLKFSSISCFFKKKFTSIKKLVIQNNNGGRILQILKSEVSACFCLRRVLSLLSV